LVLAAAAEQLHVSRLIAQAAHLNINPERLARYASLYAQAWSLVQHASAVKDEQERAYYEAYGALHCFINGRKDPALVKEIYKRGRQAAQRIDAALLALRARMADFQALCAAEAPHLPISNDAWDLAFDDESGPKEFFRGIKYLDSLRAAQEDLWLMSLRTGSLSGRLALPTEELLRCLKDGQPATTDHLQRNLRKCQSQARFTERQLALLWWDRDLAFYKGKWKDMYWLAECWGISDAADLKSFRSIVTKLSRTITSEIPTPL
jgi:hypothetical protein